MTQGPSSAQSLRDQRMSLSPTFLTASMRPPSEMEGYALQREVNHLLSEQLGAVAGLKIGCTTPVTQRFLGISGPCAGEVFCSTITHEKGTVRSANHRKLGVECELVAILGADIQPQRVPYTVQSISQYFEAVAPGIEIVDDRYLDYRTLGAPTLIADNFFNAGCVLGVPFKAWRSLELPHVTAWMEINGMEVGRGTGAMVLGHPLEALAWLANLRASQGLGLKQGQFVFLGSLIETKWISTGDLVVIGIDFLGNVELRVT
ncbi:2-keto-4-pentenoate hydratase [Aestuariivirga sp.]|uniref:2-keto-4-pentenoate hydratase n=1 Tax=Aestuariivirga sp. TaxID=2650926 RepID=UPI0039E6852E